MPMSHLLDDQSPKLRDLLRISDCGRIIHAVLGVEFYANRIISNIAIIHTSALDANLIGHDF